MSGAASTNKDLFFRALADRTRLRLLNLMGDREVCVCFFVEILGMSQPKVSRHLAYLRRAGLVAARRDATWMHYRIVTPNDEGAARVLGDVLGWIASDPEMKRDLSHLERVSCSPDPPVLLRGAPRPNRVESRDSP
jgi:ArsR family transcriptional regulator, arsenate/arsenite/antimonite-responsive transcriptional repressor